MSHRLQFCLILFGAIILRWVPFVNVPLKWIETYFHELSHGLVAIATGGKIQYIELYANGGGLCVSQGGIGFLISFAGYFGASLWGVLMVRIAQRKLSQVKLFYVFMLIILAVSMLFWLRGFLSFVIVLVISAIFALPLLKFKAQFKAVWLKPFILFIGITTILNAILSPLYLLDGRHIGDGASLAQQTWIPEIVWVLLWCLTGVASLHWCWRKTNENER